MAERALHTRVHCTGVRDGKAKVLCKFNSEDTFFAVVAGMRLESALAIFCVRLLMTRKKKLGNSNPAG